MYVLEIDCQHAERFAESVTKSVEWRNSDLDVEGSRPPAATRHIHYVLLINNPYQLNLLYWLLILYNKKMRTFYYC